MGNPRFGLGLGSMGPCCVETKPFWLIRYPRPLRPPCGPLAAINFRLADNLFRTMCWKLLKAHFFQDQ